jgi:hypothetical protein
VIQLKSIASPSTSHASLKSLIEKKISWEQAVYQRCTG